MNNNYLKIQKIIAILNTIIFIILCIVEQMFLCNLIVAISTVYFLCYLIFHSFKFKKIPKKFYNWANEYQNSMLFLGKQLLIFLNFLQLFLSFLLTTRIIHKFFEIEPEVKRHLTLTFSAIFILFSILLLLDTLITIILSAFYPKIYQLSFLKQACWKLSIIGISFLLLKILGDIELTEFTFTIALYEVAMWFLSEDRYILFNQQPPEDNVSASFFKTLLTMSFLSFSANKLLLDKNLFPAPFLLNLFSKSEYKLAFVNLILTVMILYLLLLILLLYYKFKKRK